MAKIAQSDVGTTLYVATDGVYGELIEVKDVPASGQAGGNIEVTTLKSAVKLYIADRPDTGDMDYTYNFIESNYTAVKAICDGEDHDFMVVFQDGTGFTYSGQAQTWTNDVSTGSAVEATLHTVVSTAPVIKTSSEITALLS